MGGARPDPRRDELREETAVEEQVSDLALPGMPSLDQYRAGAESGEGARRDAPVRGSPHGQTGQGRSLGEISRLLGSKFEGSA